MTLVIKTTGWEDYLGDQGAWIKALIMGPPGAGKTRSASFWPDPIFADCEEGRMSIADRGVAYGAVRTSTQMNDLLDQLKKDCAKPVRNRQWQTFVVDTIDSYQRICIQERLESERKEALQGWADWGHLDAKMTQFLEKLLNLPMNIVVNLHVKETVEDIAGADSKLVIMAPKLKGDLRDQIATEFDLVGYMSTYWAPVDGERTLQRGIKWFPEPKYPILKDRSGRLPRHTNVTFTEDDYLNLYTSIVGDHIDEDMPSASVVAELGEADGPVTEPATEMKGGPVAVVKDFPRTKADKKDPPAPVEPTPPDQIPIEIGDAKPAPVKKTRKKKTLPDEDGASDTTTDVPTSEVAKEEVTSADKTADKPEKEALLCGTQPARLVGKSDPAPGCGKPLQDKNRGNITLLRTNTYLCDDCFQLWKDAN